MVKKTLRTLTLAALFHISLHEHVHVAEEQETHPRVASVSISR